MPFSIRKNDCFKKDARYEEIMYNVMSTLAPSILIGPSSFLQVARTAIKAWMISEFGKIGPGTAELAILERLEKFL